MNSLELSQPTPRLSRASLGNPPAGLRKPEGCDGRASAAKWKISFKLGAFLTDVRALPIYREARDEFVKAPPPRHHLEVSKLAREDTGHQTQPALTRSFTHFQRDTHEVWLWFAIAATSRYLARMLQRTLPAGFISPCLPSKTDKLPSGSEWLHEIKHDGFRIIVRKKGAACL